MVNWCVNGFVGQVGCFVSSRDMINVFSLTAYVGCYQLLCNSITEFLCYTAITHSSWKQTHVFLFLVAPQHYVSVSLLISCLSPQLHLKPQLLTCLFGGCKAVYHELVSKGFRGRKRKEMLFPLSGVVFDCRVTRSA